MSNRPPCVRCCPREVGTNSSIAEGRKMAVTRELLTSRLRLFKETMFRLRLRNEGVWPMNDVLCLRPTH